MTRMSIRRRMSLAVIVVSTLLATLLGTGTANAATTTSFFLNTAPVTGPGGYKITMTVFKSGTFVSLTVNFVRTAATGNHPTQAYTWSFSLPGGDATFASDLTPTAIDTHSDLGTFGLIKMSLRNAGPLKTTKTTCHATGKTTGSFSTRTGTMKGTFDLKTGPTFFGEVKKGALPLPGGRFIDAKLVSNGTPCPSGCPIDLRFGAQDTGLGGSGLQLAADRVSSTKADIKLSDITFDSPATIYRTIEAKAAPLSAFAVNSAKDVTINGGALAPFVSLTKIKFTHGSSNTTGTTHCKETTTQETYASGSVKAKFEHGGQKTMAGASSASLTRDFKV